MKEKHHLEDLREIREIMQRSSRFISLSGLSGVLAGLYALIGAFIAWGLLYDFQDYFSREVVVIPIRTMLLLILDGLSVLFLSLFTGLVLSKKMANNQNRKIWDVAAKRLVANLAIPLITGGIFSLLLLQKGYIGLVAPTTLIFYGLALINGSKYTIGYIRNLGIIEILIGLIATFDMGNGLVYWSFGFGVMHILYGIIMYYKYEK